MTDASPRPAPMEGAGAYNRNSRVQAAGRLPAIELLRAAAERIPLPAAPIVIADYGASEGHNSMLPIGAAIAALRARLPHGAAIAVVHTDLPNNDFSGLFRAIATDPDSYTRNDAAVFPSAVGRSFYGQILPPASVDLGWSSWAVQWMSRVPAEIPDQVQVAFSRDPAARAAYAEQAAEDWRAFLAARSRELRPGGRLVVLTMATDDSGDFGYRPLVEAMFSALEEMVGESFLDAEELMRMAIPTYGRSRAEFLAPFADGGRFEGLTLERFEIFDGEDRIWADYEKDGDAKTFAGRWAAFTRASTFPTLASALAGGGGRRVREFMDRAEAAVGARLAARPQKMRIPLAKAVLQREAGA
jgi:hypothetical protein